MATGSPDLPFRAGLRNISYECKLRLNKIQQAQVRAVLIASRRLDNACLKEFVEHDKATEKHTNLFEQDKKRGAKEYPDPSALVVDTALEYLHPSFAGFFRGRKGGKRLGSPPCSARKRELSPSVNSLSPTTPGESAPAKKEDEPWQ